MRLGVDVGGTSIKAARVQGRQVEDFTTVPTPASSGPEAVLDAVASAVKQLERQPPQLGVAIPGEVDRNGFCYRLPNIPGFEGVPIGAQLSKRLGCPVVVQNDATAAALGEQIFGWGEKYPSFLLITLGTGIGGGLVLERRLYAGKAGFAGEVGHINVDYSEHAPLCACGQRGCLEAFAGTRALLARFGALGGNATEVRPIADSARRGEAAGLGTFLAMGSALGRALVNIQNLLDLDALVFSGGISAAFDLIEPGIRATLRAHAYAPPLAEVPMLVSELGEHAGVIGAAHLS